MSQVDVTFLSFITYFLSFHVSRYFILISYLIIDKVFLKFNEVRMLKTGLVLPGVEDKTTVM